MATKPQNVSLNRSSVDILNAIRNSASANYQNYVPAATADAASIKAIGNVIMTYPALQNEYLTALINRIGLVLVTSKSYQNPWSMFKKGILEFGETIEEVFVNIAKPFQYDPAVAETKVFAREIPDVRAAFHIMNYQKFYKATIQNEQLRQSFLSWDGVSDMIAKIVDSMYTAANYDEFQVMKYMLAKHLLAGHLTPVTIDTVSSANMKSIISTIKGVSNNFEFMSTKYNLTGVANYSNKNDQFIIVNADFDASMDVEVLAAAFNMDKADFMGHRVMIDSFGSLDDTRLNQLFADDSSYTAITEAEKTALNEIPAIIVDREWFMIFDNLANFTENYNGEGLYWNYWYHVWKVFSVSPFANAAAFVPGTPTVTSVSVSPATATVAKGQSIQLTATVVTTNFASQAVNWTLSATEGATITPEGLLTIASDFSGTSITVTATSVADATKTATSTITVS